LFGTDFASIYLPLQVLPRQPVSYLCVSAEEQHVAVAKLESQHQTSVVGGAIKLKSKRRRRIEPTAVDTSAQACEARPPILIVITWTRMSGLLKSECT
jgi:hypothetical protein